MPWPWDFPFARLRRGPAVRPDGRFTFGTWKIEVLGGYTSALPGGRAGPVLYHSVERLFAPGAHPLRPKPSCSPPSPVVNLVCAFLLRDQPDHHLLP